MLAVAKPTLQAYMIAGQHRLSGDPSHFESLMERAEDDYPNDAVLMQFRGKMYHTLATIAAKKKEQMTKVVTMVQSGGIPPQQLPMLLAQMGVAEGQTLDSALSAADKDHAIYAAKAPGSLKAACERFDEQDGAAHPAYIEALLFCHQILNEARALTSLLLSCWLLMYSCRRLSDSTAVAAASPCCCHDR